MELSLSQYSIALFAAVCIGLSKTGFSGISLIAVLLLEDQFGAKTSVGLVLPLLILADLCVYPAFRRFGSWKPVWRLLAPALIGIGGGLYLLKRIDDELAASGIGVVIGVMALLQLIAMFRADAMRQLARSKGFGFAAGVLGGVATMMANAAGPLIKMFLLSRGFEKMELLGVAARFFLLVNLIKLPLSGIIGIVTAESLKTDLTLAPGILFGVWAGRKAIERVPQRVFAWMVLFFALVAAFRLIF